MARAAVLLFLLLMLFKFVSVCAMSVSKGHQSNPQLWSSDNIPRRIERRTMSQSLFLTCVVQILGGTPSDSQESLAAVLGRALEWYNQTATFSPKRSNKLSEILEDLLPASAGEVVVLSMRGGSTSNGVSLALSVTIPSDNSQAFVAAITDTIASGQLAAQVAKKLDLVAPVCQLLSPPQLFDMNGLPLNGNGFINESDSALSAGFILPAILPTLFVVAALATWVQTGAALELLAFSYRSASARKDSEIWAKIEAVRQLLPDHDIHLRPVMRLHLTIYISRFSLWHVS